MKNILFITLLLLNFCGLSQTCPTIPTADGSHQIIFDVGNNCTFNVPVGVSSIKIEAWGGGGSGGCGYGAAATDSRRAGGGGGGGAYVRIDSRSVTGGVTQVTVRVGAGGINSNGGDSEVDIGSANIVDAGGGGKGGNASSSSVGSGGAKGFPWGSSANQLSYGGLGSCAPSISNAGGGGEGGCTTGNGNGMTSCGSGGGFQNAGYSGCDGGNGGSGGSTPGVGSVLGGGGGGRTGSNSAGATCNGGNGGNGRVIITYNLSTLPVELTSFDLKTESNKTIKLFWQTASELRNEKFIIERSENGADFYSIGEVKGHGTTQEKQNYEFVDAKPKPGILYYRLRQVDYDGQSEIHKTISTEISVDDFIMFPNPAREYISLSFKNTDLIPEKIEIMNYTGELIQTDMVKENGIYSFDMKYLPKGIYFIKVFNNQFIQVKNFVME